MQNKEAYIKKNIALLSILCRAIICIMPFYPTLAGKFDSTFVEWFSVREKINLISLLLPMTCLYLVFFFKFIAQSRDNYLKQPIEIPIHP